MAVTVLVVDDHDGFRARARAFLESEGYEVVGEAADAASAVEAAESLRPQLVLLDVQLPDGSGFDVARQLGEGTIVVLVSSRDASDYGPRVGASGAAGFVSKAELSGERLRAILEAAS
jgi:DNA-binding NarL/FixJ family response regulator